MLSGTFTQPPHTQALDVLFCRLGAARLDEPIPPNGLVGAAPLTAPSNAEDAAALAATEPPPSLEGAKDVQAVYEWMKRERGRLETYTRGQLARLQAERMELIHQNYLNEQGVILRVQELGRKEELLGQQARTLQQQAQELTQRERALAAQLEHWCRARDELASLEEASVSARQDMDAQRAALAALRAETAALQKSREAAEGDLGALVNALEEQREARIREQALHAARQKQLEERLQAADRAETAAQQRIAEVEELEARLRHEIEDQERLLAAERRELEHLYDNLRRPIRNRAVGPHVP
jgi:hypothetical protein